jgi:integrase
MLDRVISATPDKRTRRKSMSRRSGQRGFIEKKGNAFYVRFWIDVLGQEKRVHKSIRICPISGQGKMTKPERERRAKEIIAESGADSEGLFKEVTAANLGVTFRQQAEWFLNRVKFRKRKPIKPATAKSWDNCLQKWLCPNLGDMSLASVNNPSVKLLVSQMADAGLSPKSIHNYVQIIKMVVASALNEEGEPIYLRKWNHEFIDLPEVKNQRTPTFMGDEITQIIAAAEGHFRVLYAFLAGTGLRVGEAAGIEVQDVSPDASTIRIRQSVWNGVKQAPKTPNAIREVDLCASLAAMLKAFIAERKSGFLFQTRTARPISQTNILKRNLHPILKTLGRGKAGFHSFRRFRVTHLRKSRVPEDLLRFWIGHADRTVTDGYSKLADDSAFRKVCAEQAGLGFVIPASNINVVPCCTLRESLSHVA